MADEQELFDDRKEKEELIKNFRLIDDTFMSKVLRIRLVRSFCSG